MLLSLDGRRVHYDLAGPQNAPTVCFTHSLNSDGGMWVEQLVPLLAAGYRVLRLDMRGHGGSEPVAGDYTMDELAADVRDALDVLAIRKVHFVGLSIGGMIGQGFALACPDRLLTLTLCDTLASTPPGSTASWDERREVVRRTGGLAALADATMERWFTDEFREVNPARWREIRDTVLGTSPAGFLGCAAAIQDFDYLGRLPTLKVPALVICGDEDPGTPPEVNKLIASRIPGGRYEGIANARHLSNVERPERFNRVMMSWLAVNR